MISSPVFLLKTEVLKVNNRSITNMKSIIEVVAMFSADVKDPGSKASRKGTEKQVNTANAMTKASHLSRKLDETPITLKHIALIGLKEPLGRSLEVSPSKASTDTLISGIAFHFL